MKKILAFVCLTSLSFIAPNTLAEENAVKTPAKLKLCIGCHAVDGNSLVPTYPNLAGQHSQYLEKQLKDFKGGFRKDSIMEAFSKQLSVEDIKELSNYYSQQTPK